jgi:hypothetical protein
MVIFSFAAVFDTVVLFAAIFDTWLEDLREHEQMWVSANPIISFFIDLEKEFNSHPNNNTNKSNLIDGGLFRRLSSL